MVTPTWLLLGSAGLWAADCLVPGCLWTHTASTPEAADTAATRHADTDHADLTDGLLDGLLDDLLDDLGAA